MIWPIEIDREACAVIRDFDLTDGGKRVTSFPRNAPGLFMWPGFIAGLVTLVTNGVVIFLTVESLLDTSRRDRSARSWTPAAQRCTFTVIAL
ncbi:hypothetical protein Fuma_02488 [Fuerstiella marisgermanici]|uniref:Uncharacterized protein n=1 Tax=Fuerstiella marisgermanici TaxID=1891926 RepID=A0A1P8WFP6_9PLAN|nr:hypothetical protein Fuma_02488 [Fuerstiella marisgermanici]